MKIYALRNGQYGRCLFFLRGEGEQEAGEAHSAKRAKEEKRRIQKAEKAEKRSRVKELKPKPYVDPSLQRLLNGDPSALEVQRLLGEQSRMSN